MWWFSHRLDDIWVGDFHKSQTTPFVLYNEKGYLLSYDMFDFCA